jgi:hypothetical protein
MTLKELLSGRELPVKIRCKSWDKFDWFEAFYLYDNRYFGHNLKGFAESYREDFCVQWELYEEPKKKIKLKKFMLVDSKYKRVCYEYFENKNEVARFFVHNHFDRAIEIPNEEIEVDEDIFK